jgi:hypothetical protein
MLLEALLIGVLLFLTLTFFYKQAICEFRLNQIEWTQTEKLHELFTEKVPIIIRGRPPTAFWTQEDVLLRECYAMVHIFEDRILSDWVSQAQPAEECPWSLDHARILGSKSVSGLQLWTERVLNPVIYGTNPLLKFWLKPSSACWAGEKGLWKTVAPWTIVFVTQGAINITIMTESVEPSLPTVWKGKYPSRMSALDTPFIGDLKFMDIVLRPGNMLFMPAHWFIAWTALDQGEDTVCPMVCSVEYHSPVSQFAEWSSRT